jgi:hypothetical protein
MEEKMKKVLLVLGLLAFVVTLASPVVAAPIETKAGTKAMVFQFSGLSNLGLGTYNGGIGMRYYLSDGLALRPGVQFGVQSATQKKTDSLPKREEASAQIGVNLALEKHFASVKSISPYIGAQAGFTSVADVTKRYNFSTGDEIDETTDARARIGLAALLGFEWGFTESLTLGGEYALGFGTGAHKVEVKTDGVKATTTDDTFFDLGFSTASVFLSVAF